MGALGAGRTRLPRDPSTAASASLEPTGTGMHHGQMRTPSKLATGLFLCLLLPALATHAEALGASPAPSPGTFPNAAPSPGAAPSLSVGVATGADAAARVLASDPRFAGIGPQRPELVGQSSWYEVVAMPGGWQVTVAVGWGDCPAGCISRHTWTVFVGADGTLGTPLESGDALVTDWRPQAGSGDASVEIQVTTGPVCPVQRLPPDPACAPASVAGAEIVVRDAVGTELGRFVTDADGIARGTLPSGAYVFAPQPVAGLMGTPDAVAAWVLGPDGVVLPFSYDTGIR